MAARALCRELVNYLAPSKTRDWDVYSLFACAPHNHVGTRGRVRTVMVEAPHLPEPARPCLVRLAHAYPGEQKGCARLRAGGE